MPAYRVEVSPNNRAGCQDALCKSNADKIKKGDIRFGVWVEGTSAGGHEFQSFRWRHWGCVSGKTIQNLRENLTGPLADEGEYKWDLFDGLEEMPPNYQEKIKLAIIEGKIADEDWKGDPEYNVLGKTGIRGRASSKKKGLEDEEEGVEKPAAEETRTKPAAKKRSRAKGDSEDEDEVLKPSKKRTSKKEVDKEKDFKLVRKAARSMEDENESKPARKSRRKKAVLGDEENEDVGDYVEADDKGRVKKDLKKKNTGHSNVTSEEPKETIKDLNLVRKSRVKKGSKQEPINNNDTKAEDTESSDVDIQASGIIKAKKPLRKEEASTRRFTIEGKDNEDVKNFNSTIKRSKDDGLNGIKEEEDLDASLDIEGKHTVASKTPEETYKAEKPDDPLEQIASAFCDRDGPLVSEFNELVKNEEVADSDWDGFLQKRFRAMVDSGEAADDDFNGFLRKMHERETAFGEVPPVAAKKGRNGKKLSKPAASSRARRSKVV